MPQDPAHDLDLTPNPAALVLLRQRGHLFPWVPVALALGIAAYFSLPVEPHGATVAALAAGAMAIALLARSRDG